MQKYTLLRKKYTIDKNAFIDFLRNKKRNNKKLGELASIAKSKSKIK